MTFKKNIIFSLLLVLVYNTLFSQGAQNQDLINKALVNETIQNQFNVLIAKSPNFQNFKNIKLYNLNKFSKNFKDSLVANSKKLDIANLKIQTQKSEIEKLKSTINKTNTDLTNISKDKNSINLFGARMSKVLYNSILWSIIIGLLITTFFFLFKFKNSNSVTKLTKVSLLEIDKEFETHKKASLEREQVLRRKLQDEINKQRNVK